MVNILIAWQNDASGRLQRAAAAIAAGVRTLRAADVRLRSLEAVDIDQLHWCDGLILGVHSNPLHVTPGLEDWRFSLEPHLWEAVQGKFASVFMATPEEVRKRTRAHDCAVRVLAAHGMLVIGFAGAPANAHMGAESRPRHFHHEHASLGRFSAGMVHSIRDRAGNPRRRRIIGSLVRATRRVSTVRPADAATDSASGRYGLSGMSDRTSPNY